MKSLSSLQNVNEMNQCLLIGLGNPGTAYENTRHNMGFLVIEALAKKWGAVFRSAIAEAKGKVAQGKIGQARAILLLPVTYMNESGIAARKCLEYYKIPFDHCLVIVDDADLPFGSLRLRKKGRSGGHNGLKSIEQYFGSDQYARLRIGIGRGSEGELSEYVLGHFSPEERNKLPDVIAQAIEEIEAWANKECKINGEEHVKS